MRAGTLSDPRVIALLRKYFVTVEMTELSTKHLIENPDDVALLEKYNEPSGQRGLRDSYRRFNLVGGEREVFFTPAGKMVDMFLSLHCGRKGALGHQGLCNEADRDRPEEAVRRFFDGAATALEATHGALPRDFKRLLAGTAPEVAAVLRERVTLPPGEPSGLTLRVSVRGDVKMYERLVGFESIYVSERDARGLLPEELEVGRKHAWPRRMITALGRVAYPRGGGVLVSLADASIHGAVESEIVEADGEVVRGKLSGSFRLEPSDVSERSQRPAFSPYLSTSGGLIGDFEWNVDQRRFTKFRLVSRGGTSKFMHWKQGEQFYQLGVELVPPRIDR